MPTRSRKEHKAYQLYRQKLKLKPDNFCAFCDEETLASQRLAETKHAWIMTNRFQYSHWDTQPVAEHLMIVPKRHVATLQQLPDAALLDIMKYIAEYEAMGYNVYARSSSSATKSIAHQHTHLIKTAGPAIKRMIFVNKPYMRLYG